ncbi:MAG: hypothetical protein Q9182_006224 [Xanthomendoza sp. 2 TL-2023]
MAKRLPEITIDGFAIDLTNTPLPQWLPPNVTIRKVDNYTTDLPKDEQSTYDVVRVANLATSIEDNNPGPVIKNILTMLSECQTSLYVGVPVLTLMANEEPGGYIQWDEVDTAHRSIVQSNPSVPISEMNSLLNHVHNHEHSLGPRGWIDSLPDILARYGLQVHAGQHRFRLPFAYAKIDNDTCFKDFEELSYRLGDHDDGRELRRQMTAAKEECEKGGHAITADLVVAVGRKEQ